MTENIIIMPLALVSDKQNKLLHKMSKLWNITEIYEGNSQPYKIIKTVLPCDYIVFNKHYIIYYRDKYLQTLDEY